MKCNFNPLEKTQFLFISEGEFELNSYKDKNRLVGENSLIVIDPNYEITLKSLKDESSVYYLNF